MTVCRRMILFAACILAMGGCGTGNEALDGQTDSSASPSDVLRFTYVTQETGLGGFQHVTGAFGKMWFPETVGSGAGFLDYDGDGWQDIVLVAGAVWPDQGEPAIPALRLYRNEGGHFTEVTEETGLADLHAYGMGLAIADYDNDGDPDIFLAAVERNLLLRNDRGVRGGGGIVFTETGQAAGLADDAVDLLGIDEVRIWFVVRNLRHRFTLFYVNS